MNTHQVFIVLVVDTRFLGCVADSLQERRFAGISPADYKDTKASIFHSDVIGIKVAHDRCGEGQRKNDRDCVRTLQSRSLKFMLRLGPHAYYRW